MTTETDIQISLDSLTVEVIEDALKQKLVHVFDRRNKQDKKAPDMLFPYGDETAAMRILQPIAEKMGVEITHETKNNTGHI